MRRRLLPLHLFRSGVRSYSWQTYWRIPEKFRSSSNRDTSDRGPKIPQFRQDVETNLILNKALNMSVSSVLRCTILDDKGKPKVVNGEFKRSELLSKHGLLARDLRKVDKSSDNMVPSILIRDNSILVCLLHVRALIKHDSVIIFASNGFPVKDQSLFLYDLEHKLRQSNSLSYEFKVLECILISVLGTLESERQLLELHVTRILDQLGRKIDRDKLQTLLVASKQLQVFYQKVQLIRDALEELTDDDDELADLYLSAKAAGKPLTKNDDHSTVELLLESYYNHCEEIAQSCETLLSNIKSTEDIINIVLDSNRNDLMLLELRFQIGMLGLSAGGLISALYGMNVKNFIEDTWWGFGAVSGIVGIVSLISVLVSLRRMRMLQHMTMGRQRQLPIAKKPVDNQA